MSAFYANIARYYDAEHADKVDDLLFYSQLAAEYGGPVLDVGCGTGRVIFHLAQEGIQAHGIDSEYAMLERAKRKLDALPFVRDKIRMYQGDVIDYDMDGRQFQLVLLSYNALMHFHTQEEQIALLTRLRELTAPDGRLVIDLPNAGETFAADHSNYLSLEKTFIVPDTGHLVMQQAYTQLDRAQQMIETTWIYDEVTGDGVVLRTYTTVLFRHFFYSEVALLLRLTGFAIDEIYGDVDRSPFEDGCERLVILAKPI